MNARTEQFEVAVDYRQVEEAVSSVFHTLLLHRTLGKFNYKAEESYSIGTVGTEDVDCEQLDLTYVRVNSVDLNDYVRQEITSFCDALRTQESLRQQGQITLEFYQKKRRQWQVLGEESVPWEVWSLNLDVQPSDDSERQKLRECASESLSEIILSVCACVNRPQQFVPKMPTQSDLQLVFETRFSDVQPYLCKIRYRIVSSIPGAPASSSGAVAMSPTGGGGGAASAVSSTMKKLFGQTLSL